MTETASQRACARIRAEMLRRNLSQTDLAGLIGWTQSKTSKILNGETALDLNDLATLCFGVSLRLTEAVRDHDLEFCAEMTPAELRLLEELRRHRGAIDDLLHLLRIPAPAAPRALAPKPRAKNGHKNLTT